jgi:hypothetical protein
MPTAANSHKKTTDHAVIKQWVEARNGQPGATRKNNDRSRDDVGILRINFPGGREDSLHGITWDEFFQKFEEYGLAFVYTDDRQSGEYSTQYQFVYRDQNIG